MAQPLLFATQSYRHPSTVVSSQRLVNCYAQAEPASAKTNVTILGGPGVEEFAQIGDGPIRGFIELDGVPYIISGSELYSVAEDGVGTLLSGANSINGNGVVPMSTNGLDIVMVDGTKGWAFTVSGASFTEITDSDFVDTSKTVAFVGGYYVFDDPGTDQFYISDLYDGTTYSALDYASADSGPDRVVAVQADFGLLDVFGEKSIEFWQNTGALSFPFAPVTQGVPQVGIAGAQAKVRVDNEVYFLGHDKMFYRLLRGSLSRVSTHAIEEIWGKYTVVSDAFCFTFTHAGHKFVVITFPTADATWVFDLATGLWHERVTFDVAGNETRWRVNGAVQVFGKTLVGDANSNKIGFIKSEIYTEFGDAAPMHMIPPPIHGDGDRVNIPILELDMETGVGNLAGDGTNPSVILDWRVDGSTDWQTSFDRAIGQIGARTTRIQWQELGTHYQWTFRFRISDPVKRIILGARTQGMTLVQG